jgi:hypothetical protein
VCALLQNLLNQLLTVDLPAMMVLPERLEISVPPSVTSIAEAAVGRDTIMRAVASAVLQVGGMVKQCCCMVKQGRGMWKTSHHGRRGSGGTRRQFRAAWQLRQNQLWRKATCSSKYAILLQLRLILCCCGC